MKKMWDEEYNVEHYVYGIEPNIFLAENVRVIPKGNVLSLAEGEGRNAVFLAKQGYTVTAVDVSSVGLAKAKKLAEENNVSINFVHADLEQYDMGQEKWDGIVSIFCHFPKEARRKLYSKVISGLKDNGVFLLEAYTPSQLLHGTGGPPSEDMLVSKEKLTEELKGLNFNHLIELERAVLEGTNHTGIGSVLQFIGSKHH